MKLTRIFLLLFLFVFGVSQVKAQRPMHEIHSMMLYNFMKYVNWPASTTSGDFVIGVIGDTDVHDTLIKWYGAKSKGAQKIAIKQFNSVAEITDCHVLYISSRKSSDFAAIKSKLSGKPTLTITDKPGLGKRGSNINFKTVSGKLKFELNQSSLEESNLKVSSQLIGMSILI
ncbi:MAG: YfiR family protein [Cyclobacteriaceae bacterium]|nr:YfiR family protein [Cyclobacteriaceae bacterium]